MKAAKKSFKESFFNILLALKNFFLKIAHKIIEKRRALGIFFLLLLANIIFFLMLWLMNKYDKVRFEQILYILKSSSQGTVSSLKYGCAFQVSLYSILLTTTEVFLYYLLSGKFRQKFHKIALYKKYTCTSFCRFMTKTAFPFALAGFVFSASLFVFKLDVHTYVGTVMTESDFIENNYADPTTTTLTFPEKKRNLIYIFLESMEATFADPMATQRFEINRIPELTTLANENVSFSNTDGIGGALPFSGTTWTAAAMVSQTSGLTIKVPITAASFEGEYGFLPGAVTIGDILNENGYNQVLLVGSDSRFGSRKPYFTEHGEYQILDTISLKEEGRLPLDYDVWWGYEDAKLFKYAKEELERLVNCDEPFNLTMLTCDTHFPNGYPCELCPTEFEDQYSNVLSCSSKQIYSFIKWYSQTYPEAYENTTIVLCGDHLTMDPDYLDDLNEGYVRTTYNCFINSAVKPINQKNRLFGNFDIYPTTLAAMGVKIEGDRLALGTNLFSDKQTLTEQLGFDSLDVELLKNSDFYNDRLLKGIVGE